MDHIPKPPMMTLDPNDENIILGIPDDRDPEEQKNNPTNQTQTKKEKVSYHEFYLISYELMSKMMAVLHYNIFY